MTECHVCQEVRALYGTTDSVAPWLCTCLRPEAEKPVRTTQLQMGWDGFGDFCELGCCDYSEKYSRHSCPRPKTP